MFDVALFQPEIPPNTGNIIRLCAAAGARLHLIGPLGFHLDDRALRRAGLDYREFASVVTHTGYAAFAAQTGARIVAFTTHGEKSLYTHRFGAGDVLLFGPESRGLPPDIRASLPPEYRLRIPMRSGIRSLNLANAVAIALYEAMRQCEFSAPR